MLIAHLVPGYLAAARSRARWEPAWSRGRQALLWAVALGGYIPKLSELSASAARG